MVSVQLKFPLGQQAIAFFSDLHKDSPFHAKDLLKEHLEEAKEAKARIFLGGDIRSMILPGDKRFSGIHGREIADNAIDVAVEEDFEYFKPYADLIDLICVGNHESSVIKYYHSDYVNRLRAMLQNVRPKDLPSIRHGGYTGFITLQFADKNHSERQIIYYHHGKGGSSTVTRGAIDLQRVRAGNVADVYWLGHKHTSIADDPVVRRVDQFGGIVTNQIDAFFTAGYEGKMKVSDYDGSRGYEPNWPEESFYEAQSMGGVMVYFTTKFSDTGKVIIKRDVRKLR